MEQKKHPILEALLFFFFPPKCALCKTVGYEGLCPECQKRLDSLFSPKKFLAKGGNSYADTMLTLFSFHEPEVKKLCMDWKREDYMDLHLIFRRYFEKAKKKKLFPSEISFITYLPRKKSARKKAGFDQAECIAKELAEVLEIPYEPLLLRKGVSRPQHEMKGEDRERNVRGIFRAAKSFSGENILLVDDIVTTGASAREGARVLKKAGAMKVFVFSLAH